MATKDQDDFDVPAKGHVRAEGLLAGVKIPVYIDWKDGKISGHVMAVQTFDASVKHGVEVSMPGVYSGPAAIKTREQFYGTANGLLVDCEFSEPANATDPGVATVGNA